MELEHDQKDTTNSKNGQSDIASLVTMYRYPFRVEEAEETWAELPDLLLEEIYILLANRWRSYCSQVCIAYLQKNFHICDVEGCCDMGHVGGVEGIADMPIGRNAIIVGGVEDKTILITRMTFNSFSSCLMS